jgi:hypothetical protein
MKNKGFSEPTNILFKDTFQYDIEMEDYKGIIYLPSNEIIQNYQIKLY